MAFEMSTTCKFIRYCFNFNGMKSNNTFLLIHWILFYWKKINLTFSKFTSVFQFSMLQSCVYCCFFQCLIPAHVHDFAQIDNVPLLIVQFLNHIKPLLPAWNKLTIGDLNQKSLIDHSQVFRVSLNHSAGGEGSELQILPNSLFPFLITFA